MSTYYGYLRVFYPAEAGALGLRTELDWERDLEPVAETRLEDGCLRADFLLEHARPYLFCKPVIRRDGALAWAEGANKLVILAESPQDCYPHFYSGNRGRVSELRGLDSSQLGRRLRYRLYLPAGYEENHHKRYPLLYMHDGGNLFFPQESFLGQEWEVDESLERLDAMSLIDRTIVVGIHAEESRMDDYTRPGYEAYGRALVEELKPTLDAELRLLGGPRQTGVMGSSLGGVVSFYLGWEYPEVFGNVACLSSTFGWRDDLIERVHCEEVESRRELKIYLDSGWPGDNYEVTLSMASALSERGFLIGRDLIHFAFPLQPHTERAWAQRFPLPLQLFAGKLRRAAERQREPRAHARGGARCELR